MALWSGHGLWFAARAWEEEEAERADGPLGDRALKQGQGTGLPPSTGPEERPARSTRLGQGRVQGPEQDKGPKSTPRGRAPVGAGPPQGTPAPRPCSPSHALPTSCSGGQQLQHRLPPSPGHRYPFSHGSSPLWKGWPGMEGLGGGPAPPPHRLPPTHTRADVDLALCLWTSPGGAWDGPGWLSLSLLPRPDPRAAKEGVGWTWADPLTRGRHDSERIQSPLWACHRGGVGGA